MRRYLAVAAFVLAACQQDPLGRCGQHADCYVGQECVAGVCARLETDHQVGSRCLRDGDCASWADCAAERCVLTPGMCASGADCAAWQACDGAHACVALAGYCADAAGCEVWEVCNAGHVCENGPGYCASAADCAAWQACDALHACVTAAGFCAAEADCAAWQDCGADHLCALVPGMCGSSADCASWDVCDATYTCVHGPGYCASGADCSPWEECDVAAHACAVAPGFCGTSADCEVWEVCDGTHVCANGPGYCASSADCAAWQQCDAVHACVAAPGFCGADGDCQVWERCNTTSHTCENGPQYCASDAACESWQQCGSEHVCVLGLRRCGTDADCEYAWQACGSDHVCGTAPGHCFDDSWCTEPQLCQDHVCQTPPAHCTSSRDCAWYEHCTGGLGAETCQLVDAIGYYPQHCRTAADCGGGMACPNHLCVNTWHVTQVAADITPCALTSDGQVWCWGWGNAGLLGADQTVMGGPHLVPGSDGAVTLATSGGTGFITYADGTVRSWGYDSMGTGFNETPGPAIAALSGVTQIHGYPICGIDPDTNLVCWGDNTYGHIPVPGYDVPTPTVIPGLPSGVTAFDGNGVTCAVAAGELWCWSGTGGTECGNDGRPPLTGGQVLTKVDLGSPVIDVATGWGVTCAVVEGGDVKCWGCNYYGTVGNGLTSVDPVLVPTTVVGLAGPAVHVQIADWTACVLLASGGVQCWGAGDRGYLGIGERIPAQVTPKHPLDLESGVAQLDMGAAACALKTDGTLWCWGNVNDWNINGDFLWPFYRPVQVNAPPP